MYPELYPLKFTPIYKEKIWGGKNLKRLFSKEIPSNNTGESWEISTCNEAISTVKNGPLKERKLTELISIYQEKLLGEKIYINKKQLFPLLIKLIDATDKLSVQVHPDDNQAKKIEKQTNGKTECWVILDAKKDSYIIHGFSKKVTKKSLQKNIQDGTIEQTLKKVKVSPGDVILIPAGTIHAILPGLVLMEVQQPSDITYRFFDWNRLNNDGTSRELHIEKALAVTNLNKQPKEKIAPKTIKKETYTLKTFVKSKFFSLQKIKITETYTGRTNRQCFAILFILNGYGEITYSKTAKEPITKGEFILIPANISTYSITKLSKEKLEIVKVYI